RLAGVDAEIIERAVPVRGRELGAREPACRKFLATIRHVLAAEYAKREHLLRRELRTKFRVEAASDRRNERITIATLHPVGDAHRLSSALHCASARTAATRSRTWRSVMLRVMNTRRLAWSLSGQAASSTGGWARCCTTCTTTGPRQPATLRN